MSFYGHFIETFTDSLYRVKYNFQKDTRSFQFPNCIMYEHFPLTFSTKELE